MIAILLLSLFALFFMNIPIAFALTIVSSAFFLLSGLPLETLSQRFAAGASSFPLLAVPMFIFAGSLMNSSGVTRKLMLLAESVLSNVTGSIGHVNVVTNMMMAGISGSAMADCAATTKVIVPFMVERGYGKSFSVALSASAATIGPIIPPSIIFVIYGWLSGVSVGKLFLAGALPGVLMGLYLMVAVYFISKRRGYGINYRKPFKMKTFLLALKDSLAAIIMPGIIIGGILGGVFTPTEAGGIAVGYGFIVGKFVYRELKMADLPGIIKETVRDTAKVLFVVAAAAPFGWVLSLERVPQMIVHLFTGLSASPIVILLLINILLLLLGTMMETNVLMILLVPVLLPLIIGMNMDPIQFGVIISMNLMIGTLTPPFGVLMFMSCSITKTPINEFVKEALPFYAALFLALIVVTYWTPITMWLPNVIMGQ